MLKKYNELLNTQATIAKELFERVDHPWEVLPLIKDYILELSSKLGDEYVEVLENVYVHREAEIHPSANINGPAIICKGVQLRPGAFIRGMVIVGENSVIGNSTEVKNAIIFNNCQCPHFNYVGDSILGEYAHTGAGVALANLKNSGENIILNLDGERVDTSLRKMGAILGDNVNVGCNSVLFPGTIIYPNTDVYPLTCVRGVIGANKIVKDMDNIVEKEVR